MNAFGVTFPGIPAIVLGCNPRICWGATTNPMDVTDVYQERLVLDPASGLPTATVFDGKPEPLVAIPQTYLVNQVGNGTADDLVNGGIGPLDGGVTLVVPRRNRGPIVAVDLSDPANPIALSVQYTGWGATRELDAFRIWSRAATLDEFKQGLQFFDFGSQNWAYADVDGNIAYFTSGELPLREDLQTLGAPDGGIPPFLIRDGTHTLRHEWLPAGTTREPGQAIPYQILPFAEMPQTVNPIPGVHRQRQQRSAGDEQRQRSARPAAARRRHPLSRRRLRPRLPDRPHRAAARGGAEAGRQLLGAGFRALPGQQPAPGRRGPHPLPPGRLRQRAGRGRAGTPGRPRRRSPDRRAVARLRAWDFSTPTGIQEGWDPGDPPVTNPAALPAPSAQEIANSVAATIYSVWRGQAVTRIVDAALQGLGLGDFAPPGDVALADLRHLLDTFPATQGQGASGSTSSPAPGLHP